MLTWLGQRAFSSFQINKLKQQIQACNLPDMLIFADYIYCLKAQGISDNDRHKLDTLLQARAMRQLDQYQLMVMPRLGTISPWSSKAEEIMRHCDLATVTRIERGIAFQFDVDAYAQLTAEQHTVLQGLLHDPMTESVIQGAAALTHLFDEPTHKPLTHVTILEHGREALEKANRDWGLALSDQERDYLYQTFSDMGRNPTNAELMMFAQVNSEHCRHKIFNAKNIQNGRALPHSLFGMIKHTYQQHPDRVLVAYHDNAAVMKGDTVARFYPDPATLQYRYTKEPAHFVLKVETHNHPTAISPFAGAATGSGGEIRDEAATGRGAMTKAGMVGFSVSHLHIPDYSQPWEFCAGKPDNIASSFDIMLQAPIGAARFNNEFGRPNLCGYFRSCELALTTDYGEIIRGYHKPIMLAGGLGQIRESQVQKLPVPELAKLIVLGGPALPIGIGGGAASSVNSGSNTADIDFASVQRANPEMQRRAQEVINTCWSMGESNPILSIHDVGAGGLSNALPELVEADNRGASIDLASVLCDAKGMSALEIWCNEAQERYVLAVMPDQVAVIEAIAARERCPIAVVGAANLSQTLHVKDSRRDDTVVQMPMDSLFGNLPALERELAPHLQKHALFATQDLNLAECVERVLAFPAVADKSFLITIGDRSVTGLVARDQMVGPWQIPVADCAVTANGYESFSGEAMSVGECAPIALVHQAASARMALGEAITNIAAADINDISDISLSANWMAAADYPGEAQGLYDAVQTIAMEMCPALGIAIPVGKDSLSMRSTWESDGQKRSVTSPLSLVITAAAPVQDVRKTLTPQLNLEHTDSALLLLDLGRGANCLAGSALCQVYGEMGLRPPDVGSVSDLKAFFQVITRLNRENKLLAYHDRSDGGLLTTIVEMMFAGRAGVDLDVTDLGNDVFHSLFSEELGAVIQVAKKHVNYVTNVINEAGIGSMLHHVGVLNQKHELNITFNKACIYQNTRQSLRRIWSATSYHMQKHRDNPETAQEEYDNILQEHRVGIAVDCQFDVNDNPAAAYINIGVKPKCAVLREQGVNGHIEMAAAFDRAGFDCVDVHMQDIIAGQVDLTDMQLLAACGGFSYGDVLGAGRAWAQQILNHQRLYDVFSQFFQRQDTLTLGVCNGCQMLSQLTDIIPGSEHWPAFHFNRSQQFEARLLSVKVEHSRAMMLDGMAGSHIPIVVAHGEGRAIFKEGDYQKACQENLVSLRYIDDGGQVTERYPYNPNGSIDGATAVTTHDGRVLIMMPHPERVFRSCQFSWHPQAWGDDSPWLRMFRNARAWLK